MLLCIWTVTSCFWCLICCKKSPSVEVDTHSEATTSCEGPLLLHDDVELRRGGRRQQRHLSLFSNALLVSNTEYADTTLVLLITINSLTLLLINCNENVNEMPLKVTKYIENINNTDWFENKQIGNSSYHFGLLLNLIRYSNLAKEDQPKSISLDIFTEDIKKCTSVSVFKTNN